MTPVDEAPTDPPPTAVEEPPAAVESIAEEPKSRFKNSFSAVAESKPPPVKLPTLVFDKVTSQLTAKTDDVDLETIKPAPRAVTPPRLLSPARTEFKTSMTEELFMPDNPLVKADMDTDFKNELEVFKARVEISKGLKEIDEDVKLKIAEPDSTISDPKAHDATWDQEAPGVDKTAPQNQTLLVKALNHIKNEEAEGSRRRRKREEQ